MSLTPAELQGRGKGRLGCLRLLAASTLMLALQAGQALAAGTQDKTVVLVGGPHTEGPGRHEYENGVRALGRLLESAPGSPRLRVRSYPSGWPDDVHAFDAVDTVVLYFDGHDQHPLRDPERRRQFDKLMQRGVGLVALHQASTVPQSDDLGLQAWLGATRRGLFDRSTQWARLRPVTSPHPVLQGIDPFSYRDEFYPTLEFSPGVVSVMQADLHPQFREGQNLLDGRSETATVAWAFTRRDRGRSFGFTGAHFLSALDQPMLRTLLLNAIQWTAGDDVPAVRVATFHQDRARTGWHAQEKLLTPTNVARPGFGMLWQSPRLDEYEGQAPRLYASPLFVDHVLMTGGPHQGEAFSVVVAATSNGFVYAINARKHGDVAAGSILWKASLGAPCRLQPAPLDGVPTGILATPVVDLARQRIYVTHCDPAKSWQAYALDLRNGSMLPGWPVRLDEETLNRHNANAGPQRVPPRRKFDFRVQRGALNLSPDGSMLYVVFGETETGWLAAIDTRSRMVVGAFAAAAMPHRGSGGIWGVGGPAVDGDGSVFVVTGSGFNGFIDQPHDWTQSVLKLEPPDGGRNFRLRGTYTPFNHCESAAMDIDLGSGGAVLLPETDAARDRTNRLLAVGGKQGNLYLLDRTRLPGRLDRRPACSTLATSDGSLLAPRSQPQFGTVGPLNVFGPYSEKDAALDLARARSVPAVFRDSQGTMFLFATGNTKRAEGSAESTPPSLARVSVIGDPRQSSFLQLENVNPTLVLGNPGSPVVSSDGADHAIVWILDENAPRSALLAGPDAPRPVLYAFDATSLVELWRSEPGQLQTSGKYNEPAFGNGLVFVGTDRVQAFGTGAPPAAARVRTPAPAAVALPSTTHQGSAAGLDAAAIYRQRCALCHDDPQGNVPPRSVLASRPRQRIVEALTHGVMRAQARGLSASQIEELARYLK